MATFVVSPNMMNYDQPPDEVTLQATPTKQALSYNYDEDENDVVGDDTMYDDNNVTMTT